MKEKIDKISVENGKLYYKKKEISYNDCSIIRIVNCPSILIDGSAVIQINEKEHTINYGFKDRERAIEIFSYINSRIEEAQDLEKNYKFFIWAHTGTRLEVYEDYICLDFLPSDAMKNIMRGGGMGIKRIAISDITAVQFREPSGSAVGLIQFTYPGCNESKGGVIDAINDENSIPITERTLETAKRAVKFIEDRREELKSRQFATSQTQDTPFLRAAAELKALKELLDLGIVTQEEFDKKKKELLGL